MGRPIQKSSAGDPPAAVRRSGLHGLDFWRPVHGAWQYASSSHSFYGGASPAGGGGFFFFVLPEFVFSLSPPGVSFFFFRRPSPTGFFLCLHFGAVWKGG